MEDKHSRRTKPFSLMTYLIREAGLCYSWPDNTRPPAKQATFYLGIPHIGEEWRQQ